MAKSTRLRIYYIMLASALLAGCMFAVTQERPQTVVSGAGPAVPMSPSAVQEQPPLYKTLDQNSLKQIAVTGAIIFLVFVILKSTRYSK